MLSRPIFWNANGSPVKITPVTDTVGFVAAVDGSTVSYGQTAYTSALLDRIVEKAHSVLDAAIVGNDDSDYTVNPELDDLVCDIIDIEDPYYELYKIAYLKYYMNPLEGVESRATEYHVLSEKLQDRINTVEVIGFREDPGAFSPGMYDDYFPVPGNPDEFVAGANFGMGQMFVTGKKDVYDRVTGNLGYDDPGGIILEQLKALQTVSVLHSVTILDEDASGSVTEGDRVIIAFKRQLSLAGRQAFEGLLPSEGSFGDDPVYHWDTVELAAFDPFEGTRCTIVLGSDPLDFTGGTLTIPKDSLGSFRPAGAPVIRWLTDMQPVFDIVIPLASTGAGEPGPGGG